MGALGLPLLLVWMRFATNQPEEHQRVNTEELGWIRGGINHVQEQAANDENESIRNPQSAIRISEGAVAADPPAQSASIPWRAILSHSSMWELVGSYFLAGYTGYVFFTWSFLYIVNVRKLPLAQAGLWTMTPFLAMVVLSPVGGYVSDWAVRRWGSRWGGAARRLSAWSWPRCF